MDHDEALADALERRRGELGLPALAALVTDAAGARRLAAVGVRRLDAPTPVTVDDRFHLGSNTKAMTATLAALAVEGGVLAWDADASHVLPAVRREGATLVRLLSHSAGLAPYDEDEQIATVPFAAPTPVDERLRFAQFVLGEEPLFPPGSQHAYSNAGYAVAAAMVERAVGRPWEELLLAELFTPLAIAGGIGWPARDDPEQPWGHFDRDGSFVPHDPGDAYQLAAPLRPAGDVNASLDGYARFLELHLRGLRGRDELVSAEAIRYLHTPVGGGRLTERGRFHGYALGWGVTDVDGVRTSVHSGSADTFLALVGLQAERDRAAAVVTNAAGERVERALGPTLRELLGSS